MPLPKIALIISQFNPDITHGLYQSFTQTLMAEGWTKEQMEATFVPGAFEIPFMAQKKAQEKKFDAIVTLGCVIKGETAHFEYISESVAHALQRVSLDHSVPVLFGILTTYTEEQASARLDKGAELAHSLINLLFTLNHPESSKTG